MFSAYVYFMCQVLGQTIAHETQIGSHCINQMNLTLFRAVNVENWKGGEYDILQVSILHVKQHSRKNECRDGNIHMTVSLTILF